ncbi:hypothetical protein F975_01789 [Acinetobacter sp. ANC 3789]|uniref:hypothetical protein n=1 Tax=Acinetobacter sp. ANC 3789 TaxID=1217714 RepID=UPI0002D008FA|nr:hypothetical protein [Acinetobacter sp. ANC 3789]ENU80037.1 hypothetical protein F975_01789 [Acinetobacter sp. ANC 3789]
MDIQQLKPVAVERDEYGVWTHPEIKIYTISKSDHFDYFYDSALIDMKRYFNIDIAYVYFEYDVDEELKKLWLEKLNYKAIKQWSPSKPDQDPNWFLISISENEFGHVMAIWAKPKKLYRYEICPEEERQAFERNFVECGGYLDDLVWEECNDGNGTYEPNWSERHFELGEDEAVIEHASHVTALLMSWLECAKSKTIPKGYVLVPSEPTDRQKQVAAELLHSTNDHLAIYKAMVATAQW